MSNKILSVVLAVLFTSAVFAQSAELNYKAKGRTFMTAKIYFSNQNGGEEITPEEFFDYENIFFTIVPATPDGKNYFKESEISEDLGLIKLKQGFMIFGPSLPQLIFALRLRSVKTLKTMLLLMLRWLSKPFFKVEKK